MEIIILNLKEEIVESHCHMSRKNNMPVKWDTHTVNSQHFTLSLNMTTKLTKNNKQIFYREKVQTGPALACSGLI